jgi:glyoxylase-like metal-dependent hydrolase (beta-lactamase superfamily II)
LVHEIPGHSAGHVVYVWDAQPPVVFVGDVIFAGSIGRTDFPDGDFRQLADGIHAKLFSLPDQTVLLSGHGPPTTVGQEKRTNPFVGLKR